jgi:hypothetical protein
VEDGLVQIADRRVAGAEIVEGNADAERANQMVLGLGARKMAG